MNKLRAISHSIDDYLEKLKEENQIKVASAFCSGVLSTEIPIIQVQNGNKIFSKINTKFVKSYNCVFNRNAHEITITLTIPKTFEFKEKIEKHPCILGYQNKVIEFMVTNYDTNPDNDNVHVIITGVINNVFSIN